MNLLNEENGQAVLETAIIMPVILIIIMGGISLSLLLYSQTIVTISAANGARVGARVWNDDSLSQLEKKEKIKNAALVILEDNLSSLDRRYLILENDGMLEVTVEYDMNVSLPFAKEILDGNILTISSTSYYYVGE